MPILESISGLTIGADSHLAFSPERVDPGRTDWMAMFGAVEQAHGAAKVDTDKRRSTGG